MWRLAIPGSAVLFLGVLTALNVGNLRVRVLARTSIPQIHSLAVLPLKNLSGDPAQDYFAAGMTDELITYLSQLGGLRVISYTSTYTYKDTKKTLPEIARELNVDAVVEGSVQRAGDRVRVNAQLIYAPQETHLWAQSYDRDLLDALAVQSTVASAIADQVRIKLTPAEQARLQTPRPVNLKALDAYLKGVDHLNHVGHGFGGEEVKMAVESFQEAIAQDPGFAAAYVKLAEAYGNEAFPYPMESLPFQRAAIEKALSLAPNSSQVHLARGYFRFTRDWDWRESEAEFKRALELNPNDPQAHVAFAEYLEAMGRLDEGMQERQRARELDPTIAELCTGFFRAKQYDLGIQILKKRLEITPNDGGLHLQLSDFYAYKGMEEDSIAEKQRGAALFGFGEAAQHLGQAFSSSGYRGALRALAKEMEKAYQQGRLDAPSAVAEVYTRLGEKDEAFRWLQRAYDERDAAMVFLNVEPFWDPLRSDARFKDLVRRVGLPQ
jgi:TolB-like protein/Tfp pilus assembly protein PilF